MHTNLQKYLQMQHRKIQKKKENERFVKTKQLLLKQRCGTFSYKVPSILSSFSKKSSMIFLLCGTFDFMPQSF